MNKTECLSCNLVSGVIQKVGPIFTTNHFDIHQDQETPIPGFVIITAKRHITNFSDLSEDELKEFPYLIKNVRDALKKSLDSHTLVLVQKESTNRHFHFWMFPQFDWMQQIQPFGTELRSVSEVIKYAKATLNTKAQWEKVKSISSKISQNLNV